MSAHDEPPGGLLDSLETDALFARIFRESPTAMAITAPESNTYIDVNDAYARLLGVPRDRLIGRPNNDVPLTTRETRALVTAAGETRHIIASTRLESWQDKSFYVTLVQDMTHLQRGQDVLRASEARLRLFFKNLPLPLLVFDVESLRILDANTAAARLYGYSRRELRSMSMLDIRPPELRQKFINVLNSLSDSVSAVGLWKHRNKDGRTIDLEIVTYGMEIDGRRARLSVLQDVTEQLAMQETVRGSEERLRLLAEITNDLIWEYDPASGNTEIKYGLRELLGYDPAGVYSLEWWNALIHPEDWPALFQNFNAALDGSESTWSDQYRIRKAGGEYIYVYSRGHIQRDEQGRTRRMIGAMIDITRQIEVQEAVARAELEERHRLARDLHDAVTQSLYSLSLLAEAARRHAQLGDRKAANDYVVRLGELARQALKEMRLLVYEMRPSVLEQEGLVGALQARLDAVERQAGIRARLNVDVARRLPPVPQLQLYRVTEEALNNALKHASATAVRIDLRYDGTGVVLEISDNGQGFDPQAARYSSGLGLVSIRERVEKLGGQFELKSAPGQGTEMRITLDAI